MSIKKFLIIAIVLSLFTVGAVSAASIADQTTDLLEKNGYKVNTHEDDLVDEDGNQYSKYTYMKESDTIMILYMYDFTVTANDLQDGFKEKTINNTKGFYKDDRTCLFHYPCGDDSVLIKSTDRNIISKIVLGNDPIE